MRLLVFAFLFPTLLWVLINHVPRINETDSFIFRLTWLSSLKVHRYASRHAQEKLRVIFFFFFLMLNQIEGMSPHCFGGRRGRHRNNTWPISSLETLRKTKREAFVIRTNSLGGRNEQPFSLLFVWLRFFAWVWGVISGLVALLCEKNHSCHREAFAYSVNNCFWILIFLFQIKRIALEISQGSPSWERRGS